MSKACRYS